MSPIVRRSLLEPPDPLKEGRKVVQVVLLCVLCWVVPEVAVVAMIGSGLGWLLITLSQIRRWTSTTGGLWIACRSATMLALGLMGTREFWVAQMGMTIGAAVLIVRIKQRQL